MNKNQIILGKILSLDSMLRPAEGEPEKLSLRGRGKEELYFLTPRHQLITMAPHAWGRGPNRILVEQVPSPDDRVVAEGWHLTNRELVMPTGDSLSLENAKWHRSDMLEAVKDFPGHLRNALNRIQKKFNPELETRLQILAQSLKTPLAESVELPLLKVIGFGEGNHPIGDAALCGLLLTGRAVSLGKRLRANWLPRLIPEMRRFLHRTPKISAALIRFALEGRTTERQERFFAAMSRDYESAVETALSNIAESAESGSFAFLAGVRVSIEMILQDMEISQNSPFSRSSAGRRPKS